MVERDVLHVNNTDEDLSASDLSLHFKSLRLAWIPWLMIATLNRGSTSFDFNLLFLGGRSSYITTSLQFWYRVSWTITNVTCLQITPLAFRKLRTLSSFCELFLFKVISQKKSVIEQLFSTFLKCSLPTSVPKNTMKKIDHPACLEEIKWVKFTSLQSESLVVWMRTLLKQSHFSELFILRSPTPKGSWSLGRLSEFSPLGSGVRKWTVQPCPSLESRKPRNG